MPETKDTDIVDETEIERLSRELDEAWAERDSLSKELLTPRVYSRLVEWLRSDPIKPAAQAFTASIERQIAYALEMDVVPLIKRARAGEEALRSAADWQDISTAPKDGSKILAWDGDYVIVRADPNGGWSDDFQQYLRLDKWMPLPPRPGDRTDSGEAQSISLNQTSIPEGYVLVPREPDADMAEVARDWAQRDWNAFGDPKGYLKFYQGIYRAMINAVPKPEGE